MLTGGVRVAVLLSQPQLLEDGWGANPRFFAFMAELQPATGASAEAASAVPKSAVGFALCYYAYSTWTGTCLFLEDLYVQERCRGLGVGMALMTRCIRAAKERNCARVQFQALDWNTPALDFYARIGATETRDWIPIRFDRMAIDTFLTKFDSAAQNVGSAP